MTLSEHMSNGMLNSRNLKYDTTDSTHTLTTMMMRVRMLVIMMVIIMEISGEDDDDDGESLGAFWQSE